MNRTTPPMKSPARTALLTAAALCLALAPAATAADIAQVRAGSGGLDFQPQVEYGALVLTVSGPDGFHHRAEFGAGESPAFSIFDKAGAVVPDGSYTWELSVVPSDAQRRDAFEANRMEVKRGGVERQVQTGGFAVVAGSVVAGGETEPGAGPEGAGNVLHTKDQVIPDDLIVQMSLCVGFDCVNNENFGFDTIRLKENNLRMHFDDTSSTGSFPNNDWRLVANDSANGGRNVFYLEDSTSGREVFSVEAGAPTNSVWVDATAGNVGFGTSTPVLQLHVKDGNTPGLRLEQDGSSGFQAQTWDVAGNEANFFVRSASTGSQLSFRIRPGAPTSSIDIAADGDVGIGTSSPSGRLHVKDGTTEILFAETIGVGVGTISPAAKLHIVADSLGASARYVNSNGGGFAGTEYFEGATQGLFVGLNNGANTSRINTVNDYELSILTNGAERITFPAAGTDYITSSSGAHLTNTGTWADASSREYKQDIESLGVDRAMEALEALVPVSYRYRVNPAEEQVGFIAEEVPELVAMPDRKSLAALEIVAVLTRVVQDQERRIESLAIENEEFRRLVNELLERESK